MECMVYFNGYGKSVCKGNLKRRYTQEDEPVLLAKDNKHTVATACMHTYIIFFKIKRLLLFLLFL